MKKTNKADKKISRLLTLLILLVASLGWRVADVVAGERSIQISPPVVDLEVTPGVVSTQEVTVTNGSDSLLALEAFVRDFVAGPDGDAPRILGDEETSSYSLKNWLLLSEKAFTLQPNETKKVTLTIAPPQEAEPGGHYGLVGFAGANEEIGEGVVVRPGVATLFLVTVAGKIKESATISRFSAPGLTLTGKTILTLALKNSGNVHLRPAGTIKITNLWGHRVAELPVNGEAAAILPDSERHFLVAWEPDLALGRYQAQATTRLSDRGETLFSRPITFWVIPLRGVAAGLIGLVVLILLLYEYEHLKAHRRQSQVERGIAS